MKKYIKSIELLKEYRGMKPFSFELKEGVNIIVGENGSGKSSLLNLLFCSDKEKRATYLKVSCDPVETIFFDTEQMNPRTKNTYSGPYDLVSRFHSHGESILPIVQYTEKVKDKFIGIDEPEAGISLKNQYKVLESLNKSAKNNCQLIITTHSYIIIENTEEVFDLNKKKWVKSKNYLKSIKTKTNENKKGNKSKTKRK